MKHLSLWLTVLVMGVVPLAAAAQDYDPNRALVAVENGGPQMLGESSRTTATGALPKPDAGDADDTAGPMPRATPSAASTPSPATPRNGGSGATKPVAPGVPKPSVEPNPASWRSLLPGSIQ